MITQEELKRQLNYDPETGDFTRKIANPSSRVEVGDKAETQERNGSKRVRINNHRHCASKLAWFYMHGFYPTKRVYHVNKDLGDNRISNLRLTFREVVPETKLTQAYVKKHLHYDPSTGVFTRLTRSAQSIIVGAVAGFVDKDLGYTRICVGGAQYLGHRLAWLYVHGYFPEHGIDHLNGIRDDNRIENLRHVPQTCNLQNKRMNSKNTSGFNGVSFNKRVGMWQAEIGLRGKNVFLGHYLTALEAGLARYTFEITCDKWSCDERKTIISSIQKVWPEFSPK